MLTIKRYADKTVLKTGRKTYGEITENKNPDYKFVLWLRGGIALSGFESEQKAINRAEQMNNDCNAAFQSILNP